MKKKKTPEQKLRGLRRDLRAELCLLRRLWMEAEQEQIRQHPKDSVEAAWYSGRASMAWNTVLRLENILKR